MAKKKASTGHDKRSLEVLRERGYTAETVNRWVKNQFGGKASGKQGRAAGAAAMRGYRKDAFGFMDILAFKVDEVGATAVQCTTHKQIAAHLKNYRRDPEKRQMIIDWLLCGNRLLMHGWRQIKVATVSKKAKSPYTLRWTLTERYATLEDMELKPHDPQPEE